MFDSTIQRSDQCAGEECRIDEKKRACDRRGILGLGVLGALVASLCCLTPVVLVLVGLGAAMVFGPETLGVSSTGEFTQKVHEWTDLWYDNHKWAFRAAGLVAMGLGLLVFFRRRGVCTLSQAKRQRNRIMNVSLLVLLLAGGFYLVWNYVILHYWGVAVGLPW